MRDPLHSASPLDETNVWTNRQREQSDDKHVATPGRRIVMNLWEKGWVVSTLIIYNDYKAKRNAIESICRQVADVARTHHVNDATIGLSKYATVFVGDNTIWEWSLPQMFSHFWHVFLVWWMQWSCPGTWMNSLLPRREYVLFFPPSMAKSFPEPAWWPAEDESEAEDEVVNNGNVSDTLWATKRSTWRTEYDAWGLRNIMFEVPLLGMSRECDTGHDVSFLTDTIQ